MFFFAGQSGTVLRGLRSSQPDGCSVMYGVLSIRVLGKSVRMLMLSGHVQTCPHDD